MKDAREAFGVHAPNYLTADGAAALIRQIEHLTTSDTLRIADALPKLGLPARFVWRELGGPLRRIAAGSTSLPRFIPAKTPKRSWNWSLKCE